MKVSKKIHNLETESAFAILAKANKLSEQGKNIINLGIGQPDFLPPKNVINKAISTLNGENHGYTSSKGLYDLRDIIKTNTNRLYETEIDPEQILISPGGKVIIYISIMLLGGKNSEILIPDPGFPIYRSITKYSGAKPIYFSLNEKNNFSLDAEEVINKLNSKTRLIILNSPSNPCGSIYNSKDLDKIVHALKKFPNVFILSDEIYADLIFKSNVNNSMLVYHEIKNRLIVLNGLSKNFAMTGWRIGWGIFPKELIDAAEKLAINIFSCVNIFTQYAAIEALSNVHETVIINRKNYYEKSKLMSNLLNSISGISCLSPEGAFYCFPNIKKTGFSSDFLQNKFLEDIGIATISGSSFGIYGNGYLRLSCATSENNIIEACSKIEHWISKNK